jgi:hypothetical protein
MRRESRGRSQAESECESSDCRDHLECIER